MQRAMSVEAATTRLRDAACGALMAGRLEREQLVTQGTTPFYRGVIKAEDVSIGASEIRGGEVHDGRGQARGKKGYAKHRLSQTP